MKNRRLVIVAILLISVVCLGVAFAALVDDLAVDGSLALDNVIANEDFNQDVHFDATKTPTTVLPENAKPNEKVTVTISDDDNDHANDQLNITIPKGILNFTGDKVEVTAFVVNNSSEFDAKVDITGQNTDSSNLCTITCKIDNATTATIAKGGSAIVKVEIKLNETVTGSEDNIGGTFSFGLTATSVKPAASTN